MTDAAIDQTHALLLHLADFLKKLPSDQVGDLLNGEAKLAVIPKGARVGTGPTSRTAKAAPVAMDAEQIAADLARIDDRAAANRYIDDLKLTVPALKELCKQLDVPVPAKATKQVVVDTIVNLLVGRRIDSDALQRHAR
ncbi:MAG: hypothetical protein HOV77_02360 [Hamadaea sp.]|uniref:hypothetical protein n=1 Tax=Hamadaea sp. TaxID=2024425 RepID=UPI0017F7940A|nr:hypothetical protein [Hamadaea sp.]NUT18001.1 hypothetical protein [Hamadaea sp.]